MKSKFTIITRSCGILLLLAVFLLQVPSIAATPKRQAGAITAFVNVNVIPMDIERVLENQTVIVQGDRITAIGPADEVTVPATAQVVAGEGAYLIPGLADMHFHIEENPDSLTLAVANGVTTIQNLNAEPDHLAQASEVAAGQRFGPRIINGPDAQGLPGEDVVFVFKRLNLAAAPFFSLREYVAALRPWGYQYDAESGRQFVLQAKEAGGDFIKTNLFVDREALDAIVATAKELDMKVQGHVWGDVEHYIRSGAHVHHVGQIAPYLSQNSIPGVPTQKFDMLLVDTKLPTLIALMKEYEMGFTPTVALFWYIEQHYQDYDGLFQSPQMRYVPPAILRRWQNPEQNLVFMAFGRRQESRGQESLAWIEKYRATQVRLIKDMADAGVTLLAGSEVTAVPGIVWGFSLHQEIELFVEFGLTPYQALETATRTPAEFLGEADDWGTVAVGKRADLVLLQANPLQNIANTQQIAGVMLRGDWYPQEALQAMLDDLVAAYEAQGDIQLEAFISNTLGLSGLVPAGWNELEPGVYARSNPEVDPTLLFQLATPSAEAEGLLGSLLADFGVAELPEPIDNYQSAALSWNLYMLESEMAPLALALAETDEAAYLILLAAPADQIDALAETVFLPAVDALTPLE